MDHKIQEKVNDPLGIDVLTMRDEDGQSTTGLNGQFVHSQQLMDVLLRMRSRRTDRATFYTVCAEEYSDNPVQLAMLEEFEESYTSDNALWWYTRDSFLYRILNKALRVQNINILFLLRFFIRHIYKKLIRDRCRSRMQVYRGQLMSTDELNTLQHSIGELISINSFLSTTTDREIARSFLGNQSPADDLHRVLFEIDANPVVLGDRTMRPFADISQYSNFANESEVLFMLGSIFRLDGIQDDDDGVSIIRMTLCGDDDNDLKQLLKHMKKRTRPDLRSLGDVLKDMGKFNLAEQYFTRVLYESPLDDLSRGFLYYSLSVVSQSKSDNENSISWLEKAIESFKRHGTPDCFNAGQLNNLIGEIHRLNSNYDEALESYNTALSIYGSLTTEKREKMDMIYENISLIYQAQKKYLEALDIEEKCLSSRLEYLPAHHPDLGLSYANLGIVHGCLGHHDLALEMLQKSLKIRVKALPPYHLDIGINYQHIGLIYQIKNESSIALKYFQMALSVFRQELSIHHANIIKCEQDIQRLQVGMV